MKNKIWIWSLVLIVLLFGVPSVAAWQGEAPPPVTMPDALTAIIQTFLVYIVTEGLKSFLTVFKIDLTGKATVIAAALTTAVVAFLNGLLGAVPAGFSPVAVLILQLVVALLGAGGFFRLLKRFK